MDAAIDPEALAVYKTSILIRCQDVISEARSVLFAKSENENLAMEACMEISSRLPILTAQIVMAPYIGEIPQPLFELLSEQHIRQIHAIVYSYLKNVCPGIRLPEVEPPEGEENKEP